MQGSGTTNQETGNMRVWVSKVSEHGFTGQRDPRRPETAFEYRASFRASGTDFLRRLADDLDRYGQNGLLPVKLTARKTERGYFAPDYEVVQT
jgi:hypothetical protein